MRLRLTFHVTIALCFGFDVFCDRSTSLCDFSDDRLGQAVGGDKLGPLVVQGHQASLALGVDEGNSRQVYTDDRLLLRRRSPLPALLKLLHPAPRQPSFQLKGDGSAVLRGP